MTIFKSTFPPLPTPDRPFSYALLDALWMHRERTAVIDAETKRSATFQDLFLQSFSVATYLEKQHFHHGDVVCTVMHNSLENFPIFLGTALQGGALSGASFAFTEYELQYQFKDCKAKIVFCNELYLFKVLKAAQQCPSVQLIIVIPEDPENPKTYQFGVTSMTDVLNCQPNFYSRKVDVDIHRDIVTMPYSSGTTGAPKGVMLSHTNLAAEVNLLAYHLEQLIMQQIDSSYKAKEDTDVIYLPIYHMYGFCLFMRNMLCGVTTVLMAKFDIELMCKIVQEHKVRCLKVVPPVLVLLSKHPIVKKVDLSSIQAMLSAAAPAGKELCDAVMKRIPSVKLIGQGYGLTETTAATHLCHYEKTPKIGSAGKLCSGLEMKILDLQTRKPLGYNETGEVCVKGNVVMIGYLNRPQATAETIDDDGWLRTGDVGYVDKNENLFIVDRLKELIKVKGLQVAPAEIEDLLHTHPGVQDVAVIGVADEACGEIPMAFVVKRKANLKEQDVINFVKDRLSHYKQLKGGVQFIKEVPRSMSGKILRRFLRDEAELLKMAKNQAKI